MKQRFEVLDNGSDGENKAYWIRDNDNAQYGMPEHAVSLYFETYDSALTVCDILNKEWHRFLRDPK